MQSLLLTISLSTFQLFEVSGAFKEDLTNLKVPSKKNMHTTQTRTSVLTKIASAAYI
jgi:hypothetical protein